MHALHAAVLHFRQAVRVFEHAIIVGDYDDAAVGMPRDLAERRIAEASSNQYPTDWSSDGRLIVFTNLDPKTQVDIWTRPSDGQGTPTPFLQSSANEVGGRLSPDARFRAGAA